jgi:hypothetical protein
MSEEARIRPESSWLYPELESSRWFPVKWRDGIFLLLQTGAHTNRVVLQHHCETREQRVPDITWIRAVRKPESGGQDEQER